MKIKLVDQSLLSAYGIHITLKTIDGQGHPLTKVTNKPDLMLQT